MAKVFKTCYLGRRNQFISENASRPNNSSFKQIAAFCLASSARPSLGFGGGLDKREATSALAVLNDDSERGQHLAKQSLLKKNEKERNGQDAPCRGVGPRAVGVVPRVRPLAAPPWPLLSPEQDLRLVFSCL